MIIRRRVVRWRREWNRGKGLGNLKPGPKEPLKSIISLPIDASPGATIITDDLLAPAVSAKIREKAHKPITANSKRSGIFSYVTSS